MTKRDQLHEWLMLIGDWVYLSEIDHERFGMSKAGCSSALIDLCTQGRADYRVIGLKQYRANDVPAPKKGPRPPKGRT
jgi:hypothetical protein